MAEGSLLNPNPTQSPAPRLGFWSGLIAGRDGNPDEAAIAFLAGVVAIIGLKTFSVICPGHDFNAAEFSAGYGGLLSFYNASKGVLGRLGG